MMQTLSAWFRRGGRPRHEALVAALLIGVSTLLVAWLAASAVVYTIDSYIYLAKARSLVEGHGLAVPWNDGVDRKFFWGYSIVLALPVWLFDEKGFVVLACIIHILLGTVFLGFLRRVEERAGVRILALGLLMFNPLLLWWSSVPASEPLFALLVLGAIHRAVSFRQSSGARHVFAALVAALLGGLALATRAEGVLVAPILLLMTAPRIWRERRIALLVACMVLTLAPETAHLAYLHAHTIATRSPSAYLDELRGHAEEIAIAPAAWENLRAPFWTIFRFDTEADLYEKYFPHWLARGQSIIAYVYIASIVFALLSGVRRRSVVFYSALAVCGYALIHGLWYYRYERFMTVMTPFAALVLASGIVSVLHFLLRAEQTSQRFVVVLAGAAMTVTCALYGTQVSRMHAARLTSRENGRDYQALAARIERADPARRPIVTDLGPYLAYYTRSRHSYLEGETDFYSDAMPWCERGRDFLVDRNVSLLVSKEAMSTVVSRLDLQPGDYDRIDGPSTLLSLHIQPQKPAELSDHASRDFSSPPIFGGKLALESVDMTSLRSSRCGDVHVKASAKVLAALATGDELFVHADDADHPDQRLDVEHGTFGEIADADDGARRFEETFVVRIPPSSKTSRLEIWIGLWNTYSNTRIRLESGDGKRDNNRLLAGELPVSLR